MQSSLTKITNTSFETLQEMTSEDNSKLLEQLYRIELERSRMKEDNIEKAYKTLLHYRCNPEIEDVCRTIDVNYYTKSHSYVAERAMKVNLTFHTPDHLNYFIDALVKAQTEEEEARIRRNNLAIQRAYEEYQLLLKLSK